MQVDATTLNPLPVSRRSFIGRAAAATVLGASGSLSSHAEAMPSTEAILTSGSSVLLDLLRLPDNVVVYAGIDHPLALSRSGSSWQASGVDVAFKPEATEMSIRLSAPGIEPTHVHVRWRTQVSPQLLCLGDHWERSYGDLAWRGLVPERVMPWYFATHDGAVCHAYGVKTGARALCFWQVDPEGVSLWLNVGNGGNGVQLGSRELLAATVVTRQGKSGESAQSAVREFCKVMCAKPRLPRDPIYGSNDWYYAYGKNSATQTLRDVDLVAELSSHNTVLPFTVIDMGWEDSPAFPDMRALAAEMQHRKVRPGIWIRPLLAPAATRRSLLMPDARFGPRVERRQELAYDPTISEALAMATAKVKQVVDWGFELVKHDFSTYDLLGKWGSEMNAEPSFSGWSFQDRSRTNAEVILGFYEALRAAAGEKTLILGCNTVGHLGAGLFELQRTGDDTSGEKWERTRRMGVNTLAFRLPQHRTFFVQDADCVGITKSIPWELNRQWLDVLARSGTALFISPAPDAIGPEQRKAIKGAFTVAAAGGAHAEPSDWMETTCPERWAAMNGKAAATAINRYQWSAPDGASPFSA